LITVNKGLPWACTKLSKIGLVNSEELKNTIFSGRGLRSINQVLIKVDSNNYQIV
jgi:hypothetical protein